MGQKVGNNNVYVTPQFPPLCTVWNNQWSYIQDKIIISLNCLDITILLYMTTVCCWTWVKYPYPRIFIIIRVLVRGTDGHLWHCCDILQSRLLFFSKLGFIWNHFKPSSCRTVTFLTQSVLKWYKSDPEPKMISSVSSCSKTYFHFWIIVFQTVCL